MNKVLVFLCGLIIGSACYANDANVSQIISLLLLDDEEEFQVEESTVDFAEIALEIDVSAFTVANAFSEASMARDNFVDLDFGANSPKGGVIFVSDSDGSALFTSYYSKEAISSGRVGVSFESIVDGLVMMSPLMFFYDPLDRDQVLEIVKLNERYAVLTNLVKQVLTNGESKRIDPDINPEIFVLAAELIDEITIEPELRGQAVSKFKSGPEPSTIGDQSLPYLIDEENNAMGYANPTLAFYGVEIDGQAEFLLPGKKSKYTTKFDFELRIATITETEPEIIDKEFLDGSRVVNITKDGFASTSAKMATIANSLQAICHVLDGLSFCPYGRETIVRLTESIFLQNTEDDRLLYTFVSEFAVEGGKFSFTKILDKLAEKTGRNATETYFNVFVKKFYSGKLSKAPAKRIFQNFKDVIGKASRVLAVYKAYKAVNVYAPFFYDWSLRADQVGWCLQSSQGVLATNCATSNPNAAFVISNELPLSRLDEIKFDASSTTDANYSLASLSFRWDFDGDGVFETEWQLGQNNAVYTYNQDGFYDVVLEVRNPDGKLGRFFQEVEVSEGSTQVGLVAHYNFNQNANDFSGFDNHGLEFGSPAYDEGVLGQSLSLDGINDYVRISDADQIDFSQSDDFTISLWVKPSSQQFDLVNNDNDIVEKWKGGESYPYVIRYTNSPTTNFNLTEGTLHAAQYQINGADVRIVSSPDQISSTTFTHIVFQKKGNEIFLYEGGILKDSTSTINTDTRNNSELFIGARGNLENFFKGQVDELRIYNRALSQKEIEVLSDVDSILTSSSINDTGITFGGNYPTGNNASCLGSIINQQDCSNGRDSLFDDDSDGFAGFDFTKIDANGNDLPAGATNWSCVRDNVTGLVWEVKTDDGGIHDKDNTYKWGGKTALGSNFGVYDTDWNSLVDGSNGSNFCGYDDWRVPSKFELEGIMNFGSSVKIDTAYFPNSLGNVYWSASPRADGQIYAWATNFGNGNSSRSSRNSRLHVRLVR